MLAEQLVLVCDPLFHTQVDATTALDLALLTAVIPIEPASKDWYRIVPEYKDRDDCTGEDLADRETVYLTGKMTIRGTARLELIYGLKALARGTSSAPVADGDSWIHTSARLPAYDFNLPSTTTALADAAPGGTLKKLLRRVVVARVDIIAGNGEDFMFEADLDFHPDVTDAPTLVVPACSDALTFIDLTDSDLSVGGVSRASILFDARSNYNNKLREGKVRRTNNGLYPTRTLRDAKREESIEATLSTEMDNALAVAADTKAQTDYPTWLRMGTATRYIKDEFPHARLEGDIGKAEQALVTKAKFVPIKSAGVTSITTCRNSQSQRYLQPAA
jgi:hypothetical protein